MSDIYVYQADAYCERCIDAIKADLRAANKEPATPDDESTYDSDDWPKGPFDGDESDSPQHCANCHTFLEQPLTPDGYKYVRATLTGKFPSELSEVEGQWVDYYGFEYFEQPYTSAGDWLESHIADAVSKTDGDGASELADIARTLAGAVDADTIQDHFQSDMEADGYFKKTGWYSYESTDEE